MDVFFIFLFGLVIGSFLNSAIYRLEAGGNIARERSRCPKCGHILSWYELVPLLSFAVQRGACRACKKSISWQYPLVEFSCALLFVFVWHHVPAYYHFHGEIVYLWYVFASLLLIFVFDLKQYIIPNRVVYPLILITLLWGWFGSRYMLPEYPFWSALGLSSFFLLQYLISKGTWIGFGDVKFGIFMGLFLGTPLVFVAFFFSYFLGALASLFLLWRKKKALKSQIPFGPFLILGTAIAYFFGWDLFLWWFNTL